MAKKKRASKKKVVKRGNGVAEPEAQDQPTEAQPQPAKLTADQQYLQDLFKNAKTRKVTAEQRALIEMLAASEQGIVQATEKANNLERQIYELNVEKQNLTDLINNERGKARGLAEGLLKMRDAKKGGRSKAGRGKSKRGNAPSTQTLQ